MPYCSVRWCGANNMTMDYKKQNISFHRFPNIPEIERQWVEAIRLKKEYWFPSFSSVICSRHFTDDCYFPNQNRRRLIRTAVPTENLSISHENRNKDHFVTKTQEDEYASKAKTKLQEVPVPTTDKYDSITTGELMIAQVYRYLDVEYNTLRAYLGTSCDLRSLSNILQRTAKATGVTQQTVAVILQSEKEYRKQTLLQMISKKCSNTSTNDRGHHQQTSRTGTSIKGRRLSTPRPSTSGSISTIRKGRSLSDLGHPMYEDVSNSSEIDLQIFDHDPVPSTSGFGRQIFDEPVPSTSGLGRQILDEPVPSTSGLRPQIFDDEPVPSTPGLGRQTFDDEPVPSTSRLGRQMFEEEPVPSTSGLGHQMDGKVLHSPKPVRKVYGKPLQRCGQAKKSGSIRKKVRQKTSPPRYNRYAKGKEARITPKPPPMPPRLELFPPDDDSDDDMDNISSYESEMNKIKSAVRHVVPKTAQFVVYPDFMRFPLLSFEPPEEGRTDSPPYSGISFSDEVETITVEPDIQELCLQHEPPSPEGLSSTCDIAIQTDEGKQEREPAQELHLEEETKSLPGTDLETDIIQQSEQESAQKPESFTDSETESESEPDADPEKELNLEPEKQPDPNLCEMNNAEEPQSETVPVYVVIEQEDSDESDDESDVCQNDSAPITPKEEIMSESDDDEPQQSDVIKNDMAPIPPKEGIMSESDDDEPQKSDVSQNDSAPITPKEEIMSESDDDEPQQSDVSQNDSPPITPKEEIMSESDDEQPEQMQVATGNIIWDSMQPPPTYKPRVEFTEFYKNFL